MPLFALESQEPVRSLDFLGFTLQYEMCYSNVLQVLDLAGISLLAVERGEDEPIVIGGGPCAYNPEPLAAFFDLFYIGEGETQLRAVLDCYLANKLTGGKREDFLVKVAEISGIYVPSLYEVSYHEDGTIKTGVPVRIKKEYVCDLTSAYYPVKPIIPFIQVTQDRAVLELQRGCFRGCRFCQAGHIYRPVRQRNIEQLQDYAREILKNTGYDEITLSSLSSGDYSHLPELVDFLVGECQSQPTNISLPSLRIDAVALDILKKVQDVRKSSLTFAPEAGSQRLRDVINKGLSEEMILEGARLAFLAGWNKVKLYFMLGLPTETAEDIAAIGELANKIAAVYYDTVPKEERQGKVQIGVSTSFFVPKPFTPFQWEAQATVEDFRDKAYLTRQGIRAQLNQKSIRYSWHETDISVMECAMARGDRRLAEVILSAYYKGARFDAWSEHYRHELWLEAFAEQGVDIDFYTRRERDREEVLPWDFIDCGVRKEWLWKERGRTLN
jgi:radical SAM family uncharacterized protein